MSKIILIGTAFIELNDSFQQECMSLGAWFAQNNIELVTGSCPGVPYYVSQGAIMAGGKVIGYSPAQNYDEHVEKMLFPRDGCTEILFAEKDYPPNMSFFYRSIDMMSSSDIVVSIIGSRGTLSELFLATFLGKYIICAPFSGGASLKYSEIYEDLKVSGFTYGESVEMVSSFAEIKAAVIRKIKS